MSAPPTVQLREVVIPVPEAAGRVSGLLAVPPDARWLYVLAHGAGAGMRHSFLQAVAERLAGRHVATLRYQFPYMEQGSGRPDRPPVLVATVQAAIAFGREALRGLPVFAGGKSMGGRMTTHAAAESADLGLHGIVLLGFPLHVAGRPATGRADHLDRVVEPLLFLQGTRDALADAELMRQVCDRLGERATLHLVDGADHSFHVPRRSGRTDDDVLEDLADTIVDWAARVSAAGTPRPS